MVILFFYIGLVCFLVATDANRSDATRGKATFGTLLMVLLSIATCTPEDRSKPIEAVVLPPSRPLPTAPVPEASWSASSPWSTGPWNSGSYPAPSGGYAPYTVEPRSPSAVWNGLPGGGGGWTVPGGLPGGNSPWFRPEGAERPNAGASTTGVAPPLISPAPQPPPRPVTDVAAVERMPLNPAILTRPAMTAVQEVIPSLTPIRE